MFRTLILISCESGKLTIQIRHLIITQTEILINRKAGRRTIFEGVNDVKIYGSNDASANKISLEIEQQKALKTLRFQGFLLLVRMTGFEPTRISSLEPDGNDTSVESYFISSRVPSSWTIVTKKFSLYLLPYVCLHSLKMFINRSS